ncbi:MAG: hypothetical protein RRY03_03275 [Oscillospiraceae bacterium]
MRNAITLQKPTGGAEPPPLRSAWSAVKLQNPNGRSRATAPTK